MYISINTSLYMENVCSQKRSASTHKIALTIARYLLFIMKTKKSIPIKIKIQSYELFFIYCHLTCCFDFDYKAKQMSNIKELSISSTS